MSNKKTTAKTDQTIFKIIIIESLYFIDFKLYQTISTQELAHCHAAEVNDVAVDFLWNEI